jgi:PAP_fibrillin
MPSSSVHYRHLTLLHLLASSNLGALSSCAFVSGFTSVQTGRRVVFPAEGVLEKLRVSKPSSLLWAAIDAIDSDVGDADAVPSDVSNDYDDSVPVNSDNKAPTSGTTLPSADCHIRQRYKAQLVQLAASYDRGFGASPSARDKVNAVIRNLEQSYDPTLQAAARTILNDDDRATFSTIPVDNGMPSLIGNWRMIWTTAVDVLSLSASPLWATGAIHQVYDGSGSRRVTNIIDFIPRALALWPPLLRGIFAPPSTLVRALVQTRACPPRTMSTKASTSSEALANNRVGLIFESVAVQPLELLGVDASRLPPLSVDLPKLPWTDDTTSPGYFDVTYLDSELLIIRQNAFDGLFCLLRVDSIDA